MKTGFDATDIIFSFLDMPELKDFISGSVYHQNERPVGSTDEDVVVNSLGLNDTNVQSGVINVNVYVTNIKKAGTDEMYEVPNRTRLKEISDKVVEILGGNNGRYWTDGELKIKLISGPMPEPEIKQHFINIRANIKLHAVYN